MMGNSWVVETIIYTLGSKQQQNTLNNVMVMVRDESAPASSEITEIILPPFF